MMLELELYEDPERTLVGNSSKFQGPQSPRKRKDPTFCFEGRKTRGFQNRGLYDPNVYVIFWASSCPSAICHPLVRSLLRRCSANSTQRTWTPCKDFTSINIYTYTDTYTCTRIQTHARMRIHTFTCTCSYIHMLIYVYIYTDIYTSTDTVIHMHIQIHKFVRVHVHIRLHWHIDIHTHSFKLHITSAELKALHGRLKPRRAVKSSLDSLANWSGGCQVSKACGRGGRGVAGVGRDDMQCIGVQC